MSNVEPELAMVGDGCVQYQIQIGSDHCSKIQIFPLSTSCNLDRLKCSEGQETRLAQVSMSLHPVQSIAHT